MIYKYKFHSINKNRMSAELLFFSQFHCGACIAFKGEPGNSTWDDISKDPDLLAAGVRPKIYEFGPTVDSNGQRINYTLGSEYHGIVTHTPHILLRVPGTKTTGVSYEGIRDHKSVKTWVLNQMKTNPLFNKNGSKSSHTSNDVRTTKNRPVNNNNRPGSVSNNANANQKRIEEAKSRRNAINTLTSQGMNKREAIETVRKYNGNMELISESINRASSGSCGANHNNHQQGNPQNRPNDDMQTKILEAQQKANQNNRSTNNKNKKIISDSVTNNHKNNGNVVITNRLERANNFAKSPDLSITENKKMETDAKLYMSNVHGNMSGNRRDSNINKRNFGKSNMASSNMTTNSVSSSSMGKKSNRKGKTLRT